MNRVAFITMAITAPAHVNQQQFDEGCVELYTNIKARFEDPQCPLPTKVSFGCAHVELEDVRNFHDKFGVPMSPVPAFLDPAAHKYRFGFMQEELSEFQEAYDEGNLDKAFDALLDLAYVTLGTALKMGLPWSAGWQRVQAANMTKELAKPDGSNSKRKSPMDVIKPEGFVAPSHWDLLGYLEGQTPPLFNATNAVTSSGFKRSSGITEPTDMKEFVLYRDPAHVNPTATRDSLPADETAGDGSGLTLPEVDKDAYPEGATDLSVETALQASASNR